MYFTARGDAVANETDPALAEIEGAKRIVREETGVEHPDHIILVLARQLVVAKMGVSAGYVRAKPPTEPVALCLDDKAPVS